MKIFFATSQSSPAAIATGSISLQVEAPRGSAIKTAMNKVISSRMVNAMLIHSASGRIRFGSQNEQDCQPALFLSRSALLHIPNLFQGMGESVKNGRGRPYQTNQRHAADRSARPNDLVDILAQQLTQRRRDKFQALHDDVLIHAESGTQPKAGD